MYRILLFGLLTSPSVQHFIPPFTWCQLADYCNHTGISECGQRMIDSKIRKFLDECDLYEYNCDNNEEYKKVDVPCEEISTNATETPSPTSPPPTTISTTTQASLSMSHLTTINSTEPKTSESMTPDQRTTTNCTRNSDKHTPEITSSSKVTQTATTKDDIPKTSKDVVTSNAVTDINETTRNKSTYTKSTVQVSSTPSLVPCRNYPEDCDRPYSWETTAKGETRDFFQILKAKYGTRVKLLRATTHWPRRAQYVQNNDDGMFKVGRHQDYFK